MMLLMLLAGLGNAEISRASVGEWRDVFPSTYRPKGAGADQVVLRERGWRKRIRSLQAEKRELTARVEELRADCDREREEHVACLEEMEKAFGHENEELARVVDEQDQFDQSMNEVRVEIGELDREIKDIKARKERLRKSERAVIGSLEDCEREISIKSGILEGIMAQIEAAKKEKMEKDEVHMNEVNNEEENMVFEENEIEMSERFEDEEDAGKLQNFDAAITGETASKDEKQVLMERKQELEAEIRAKKTAREAKRRERSQKMKNYLNEMKKKEKSRHMETYNILVSLIQSRENVITEKQSLELSRRRLRVEADKQTKKLKEFCMSAEKRIEENEAEIEKYRKLMEEKNAEYQRQETEIEQNKDVIDSKFNEAEAQWKERAKVLANSIRSCERKICEIEGELSQLNDRLNESVRSGIEGLDRISKAILKMCGSDDAVAVSTGLVKFVRRSSMEPRCDAFTKILGVWCDKLDVYRDEAVDDADELNGHFNAVYRSVWRIFRRVVGRSCGVVVRSRFPRVGDSKKKMRGRLAGLKELEDEVGWDSEKIQNYRDVKYLKKASELLALRRKMEDYECFDGLEHPDPDLMCLLKRRNDLEMKIRSQEHAISAIVCGGNMWSSDEEIERHFELLEKDEESLLEVKQEICVYHPLWSYFTERAVAVRDFRPLKNGKGADGFYDAVFELMFEFIKSARERNETRKDCGLLLRMDGDLLELLRGDDGPLSRMREGLR